MSGLVEECEERLGGMACRRGGVLASRATVGLAAALRALGLPAGSGVLVPVMLCANVVHAVRGAGLRPVFVDIEIGDFGFGIDLAKAETLLAQRGDVRVLLAVALFGGAVDAAWLADFAHRHELVVVEDAAQSVLHNAHSLTSGPARVDSLVTVHSFGPGKIGDAGGGAAILSDDSGLLRRVRSELEGKRDLSETAARIMRSLDGLESEIAGRRRMSKAYQDRLRVEGVEHPGGALPLWKYSVLARDRPERDRVTRRLLESGIAATNLYTPLSSWFGSYPDRGKREFPTAWAISDRVINLPLWPPREGLLADALAAFVPAPAPA